MGIAPKKTALTGLRVESAPGSKRFTMRLLVAR